MRKALNNKKYYYRTDTISFTNTSRITEHLNQYYSDPQKNDVISVSVFQNGNVFNAMIVIRELRDIQKPR